MGELRMTLFVDKFGREHRDLRVSLTDKCNLRCTYCMPSEHMQWLPKQELLTVDELLRVVRIAVAAGIEEVRLTGGEPLLHPHIVDIVRGIAALPSSPIVTLTTNAVHLAPIAQALVNAGLQRFNISLDTLDRDRFKQLTRRDELGAVLQGIAAAKATGILPIKINSVLMPGINDDEAADLLDWALAEGLQLRFIEEMPLNIDHHWSRSNYVSTDDVIASLRTRFTLTELPRDPHSPAFLMGVNGTAETVGFISSVSRPFCGGCDRVRLTADGQFRNCLFAREESDLRSLLRGNASDDDLLQRMLDSVQAKKRGHGIDSDDFRQPDRSMHAIGG